MNKRVTKSIENFEKLTSLFSGDLNNEFVDSIVNNIIDDIDNIDYYVLYLYEPLSENLILFSSKGLSNIQLNFSSIQIFEMFPGVIFENEKIYLFDKKEDLKNPSFFFDNGSIESEFWLPVKSHNDCVGVFGFGSNLSTSFSKETIKLLNFISNLIGITYKNSIYRNERDIFYKKISYSTEDIYDLESELEVIKNNQQDLQKSLNERDLLIKEIHHRVKNNLQIVSSFINIRLNNDANIPNKYKFYMVDLMNKIKSMSELHNLLYKKNDFSKIDLSRYLERVIKLTNESYNFNNIEIIKSEKETFISIEKGIVIGLIILELITNSIKYAFNDKLNRNNIITIKIKNSKANLVIEFSDNGEPFNTDFDINKSKGIGLEILIGLVEQIDGEFKFNKKSKTFTFIL